MICENEINDYNASEMIRKVCTDIEHDIKDGQDDKSEVKRFYLHLPNYILIITMNNDIFHLLSDKL